MYVTYKDAQGYTRRSRDNYVYFHNQEEYSPDEDQLHAYLITDRSAFNPDETVFFKAMLYTGEYTLKNCPAGRKVTARLMDARGREIDHKDLETNEFGSVDVSSNFGKDFGLKYYANAEESAKHQANK